MREVIKDAVYCEETGKKIEDKVIRCDCGGRVELSSGWANGCQRCDLEYNGSGQQLAPRSQWGEETGESEPDFNDL